MMRTSHCMNELLIFLDKFCIMFLLYPWVWVTIKDAFENPCFTLDHFVHQAKWLRSCAHLWEFILCVCVCVWINVRVGWKNLLVDEHYNLWRDKIVFIGLEKLECNKSICSCYLLCFPWDVILKTKKCFFWLISFQFQTSSLWLILRVYFWTSKEQVWGVDKSWF